MNALKTKCYFPPESLIIIIRKKTMLNQLPYPFSLCLLQQNSDFININHNSRTVNQCQLLVSKKITSLCQLKLSELNDNLLNLLGLGDIFFYIRDLLFPSSILFQCKLIFLDPSPFSLFSILILLSEDDCGVLISKQQHNI